MKREAHKKHNTNRTNNTNIANEPSKTNKINETNETNETNERWESLKWLHEMAPFLVPLPVPVVLLISLALLTVFPLPAALAQSMQQEQAEERIELDKMRNEINDIKGTINDAVDQINALGQQMANPNIKEIHLFAREAVCDVAPGTQVTCLTYNGKLPGPEIRVKEGDRVRVVLHNQLSVPTSLHFNGMILPDNVDGLPRKDFGQVKPKESFVYQLVPRQRGTYWYHPQVMHSDQKSRGMFGAFVVEPKEDARTDAVKDKDMVVFLSDLAIAPQGTAAAGAGRATGTGAASPGKGTVYDAIAQTQPNPSSSKLFFLMNGHSAPLIPMIDLKRGARVRLRFINASASRTIPMQLSGHRMEIVSVNGGDLLEPHVFRDTLQVLPCDRIDVEFVADNPGLWSLSSQLPYQATNQGKFPGGIACIVRYADGLDAAAQQQEPGL